jgi:hypothetical protein
MYRALPQIDALDNQLDSAVGSSTGACRGSVAVPRPKPKALKSHNAGNEQLLVPLTIGLPSCVCSINVRVAHQLQVLSAAMRHVECRDRGSRVTVPFVHPITAAGRRGLTNQCRFLNSIDATPRRSALDAR